MDKPATPSAPPRAEQRPYSYEHHGVTIDDPWACKAERARAKKLLPGVAKRAGQLKAS